MEEDTDVTGNVHSNDKIDLKPGSRVAGDVSATGDVIADGTVSGSVRPGAVPLDLPELADSSVLRQLADRVLSGDQVLTDEVVDDMVFVEGKVEVFGRLDGVGTIIATAEINLMDSAAARGVDTRLSLISFKHIEVGKDRSLRAVLRAREFVIVEEGATIEGVIVADQEVVLKKNSIVTFLDFDPTPPTLAVVAPEDGSVLATGQPAVSASFSDDFSGVDLDTLKFLLDGVDRTGEVDIDGSVLSFTPQPLADGPHSLEVALADHSDNEVRENLIFTIDTQPPVLTLTGPGEGELLNDVNIQVTGTVSDLTPLTELTVNGRSAELSGELFSGIVALSQGTNTLDVSATDSAGNQSVVSFSVVLDIQPPFLTLSAPVSGRVTNTATMRFAGEAEDDLGVASVAINGIPVNFADGEFDEDVPLSPGTSSVSVQAIDVAGNVAELSVEVRRLVLPVVTITAPEPLSLVNDDTVDVTGTVNEPDTTVLVNGSPAILEGDRFTATGIPLVEGSNVVDVVAIGVGGARSTAKVTVFRDVTPPRVEIYDPADGRVVHEPTLTVHGLVNEISFGAVGAGTTAVNVNGIPAASSHRGFLVDGIPLQAGENVITATATDPSGNVGEATVRVIFEPPVEARLRVESGNLQSAPIGEALPEPLVTRLVDESGTPLSGRTVFFKVTGNNGNIGDGRRQLVVTTDAAGLAAVTLTLGTHAGAGSQRVQATSPGVFGAAVFFATALPGPPANLYVDRGDQQVGVAGRRLPDPFVAVVTDRGFNRLAGVPVTFQVVEGLGVFADGETSIVVGSDTEGRASAVLQLDLGEGVANNVVEARLADSPEVRFATFVASGQVAGDPASTSISGLVLDNSDQPVPGVTVHVAGTELLAESDEQGLFEVPAAPVGSLQLEVDGSTTSRPGEWPRLEFEMTTIAGRDNTLGRPIYLLPLDVERGMAVSETEGGTLSLPELPGFSLEVAPGSVTFPDGSPDGVVSVTLVHSDKVPMVPNFGQQPSFVVTIQPAGARFDPPAKLTLPNVDAQAPGEVVEMFSFDHDLGSFVNIGPGTVSDDGLMIASNPGIGVVEAGWHCGGSPSSSGTPHDCPLCKICNGSTCVPGCALPASAVGPVFALEDSRTVIANKASCSCTGNDPCRFNYRCENGRCKSDKVKVTAVDGPCVVAVGAAATFTATANKPDQVRWKAPKGSPSEGTGASFTTTFNKKGKRKVRAGCKGGNKSKRVSVVESCAGIMPQLKEPEVPRAPISGTFGTIFHGTSRTAIYKGCGDGTKWCFRLDEYQEEHGFGVESSKIDISGPDDPAVTPSTCAAIIADFIPASSSFGPPRGTYWSSGITTAHERFHVTDFSNKVTQRVFQDLGVFVSDAGHCKICEEPVPTGAFDSEKDRLWNVHLPNYFDGQQEVRAHGHSNPMYIAVVQGIRQRARNAPSAEGWPAACK